MAHVIKWVRSVSYNQIRHNTASLPMSKDKARFSARVQPETKETIDEYRDSRGLNRSQAIERITEQWADLTENGSVHPELVKTRNETTNSLLVSARADKKTYILLSLVSLLVYEFVALPTVVSVGVLALAGAWALTSVVGYYSAAADRFGFLPSPTTADDIEVEA